MRLLLLFFILLNVHGTGLYAQSKKKVNEQLHAELILKKRVHDSILEVQNKLQKELKDAKYQVYRCDELLKTRKNQVTSKALILSNNYRLLSELGYDANTIISSSEMQQISSPSIGKEYQAIAKKQVRTFPWLETDTIQNLANVKINVQNELLTSKIHDYDNVNSANLAVLTSEQNYKDSLLVSKLEYDKVIEKCNAQIVYIIQKSDALAEKWEEVNRQKEELKVQEYMKEVEKYKKRQKSGQLLFIPPMVMEPEGEKPVYSYRIETDYSIETPEFSDPQPLKAREIIEVVDESAEFPGGKAALNKYLMDNLVLPDAVVKGDVSGKCYVKFIVSETGTISDVQIARGIPDCPQCDEEAKRVVEKMPVWKPGTYNGKPTKQWYNLPVKFINY